jgi:hypothetical protein
MVTRNKKQNLAYVLKALADEMVQNRSRFPKSFEIVSGSQKKKSSVVLPSASRRKTKSTCSAGGTSDDEHQKQSKLLNM